MATLYVTEQGARVEKEYHKLVVTKEDATIIAVPAINVSSVVLIGNVGVTTPAIAFLLDQGIELVFLTPQGKLRGRLIGATPLNIALRQTQYAKMKDAAFSLQVSRAVVEGKLANYRTLAQRWGRDHGVEGLRTAADALIPHLRAAARANDLAELRGNEGAGSKAYFGALRAVLRGDWTFEKRARRPPPDPVNALLSLGYTLLGENIFAALEIVGLDPYAGFFHADAYGRPALALDLVEEFRGVIADLVALMLINKRVLEQKDFHAGDDGGVYLSERGLKKYLRYYTARIQTEVLHPHYRRRLTYQKCFEVQARLLRKVIEGELPAYIPFRAR
ncbi:MAG: CRISPR-associated endonuclease Cas1 [Chloroflexi bacterium]|nr:CRISPR-associated endonuclease Cas1 [Chloroflexota bacterium]